MDNLIWAETNLKVCPCCGGKHTEIKNDDVYASRKLYYIYCPVCGLRSRYAEKETIIRLVNDWNDRRGENASNNFMLWRKIKYVALWPVFMIPTYAMAMVATIGKACDIASDNFLKAYRDFVK